MGLGLGLAASAQLPVGSAVRKRPIPVARLIGRRLRLGAVERIDQPKLRQRQQTVNLVERPPEKAHAAQGTGGVLRKNLTGLSAGFGRIRGSPLAPYKFEDGWRAEHQIRGVLDLHETPMVGLSEHVEHWTALLGVRSGGGVDYRRSWASARWPFATGGRCARRVRGHDDNYWPARAAAVRGAGRSVQTGAGDRGASRHARGGAAPATEQKAGDGRGLRAGRLRRPRGSRIPGHRLASDGRPWRVRAPLSRRRHSRIARRRYREGLPLMPEVRHRRAATGLPISAAGRAGFGGPMIDAGAAPTAPARIRRSRPDAFGRDPHPRLARKAVRPAANRPRTIHRKATRSATGTASVVSNEPTIGRACRRSSQSVSLGANGTQPSN
jgi:hypothetical protein